MTNTHKNNTENNNENKNKNKIEETSKMLTETLKFITDYKNNLLKQYPNKIEISETNLPPQAF